MKVTLHGNSIERMVAAREWLTENGWAKFTAGWFPCYPYVAVGVGDRITHDARKDYRYHLAISIPE